MIFTGQYEHGIDGKNRLAIPAKWRSRLDPAQDGNGFYVVQGTPPTSLWLYTETHFEALAKKIQSELIQDDNVLRFVQDYFPKADHVELDTQGRILIPEKKLNKAGLGKDVIVCGALDHIEIRTPEGHEKQSAEGDEHSEEYRLKARQTLQTFQRRVGKEPDAT